MNIEELVKEVKRDMCKVHIPYDNNIPIVINHRTTRTLGSCYYRFSGGKKVPTKIELSEHLIKNATVQDVKNTLCHELIHSAFPNDGHKGYWKKYAKIMTNANLGYTIKRNSEPKFSLEKMNFAYKIVCPECGATSYYQKACKTVNMIKNPRYNSLYYCRKCRCNHLVVEEA